MARDHVTALVDAPLALDVDAVTARSASEALTGLNHLPGDYETPIETRMRGIK
jgi:hypothetical protein